MPNSLGPVHESSICCLPIFSYANILKIRKKIIRLEPRLGAKLKGLLKTVCSVSDPDISKVNENIIACLGPYLVLEFHT